MFNEIFTLFSSLTKKDDAHYSEKLIILKIIIFCSNFIFLCEKNTTKLSYTKM
jgi:hypothetical protein